MWHYAHGVRIWWCELSLASFRPSENSKKNERCHAVIELRFTFQTSDILDNPKLNLLHSLSLSLSNLPLSHVHI